MKYSFYKKEEKKSWLNYVCVHCQAENRCSSEACFKRTFSPVAQNTLAHYYRDTALAYIHVCNLMEILNEEVAHLSGQTE